MYSCPACGKEDVIGLAVCTCGADLGVLLKLERAIDAWFNSALEALKEGKVGRALEWLSACCVARPTDAVAVRALAKVWTQMGHWEEATDALERAAQIEPDAPDLSDIREALQEARRKARKGPRARAPERTTTQRARAAGARKKAVRAEAKRTRKSKGKKAKSRKKAGKASRQVRK